MRLNNSTIVKSIFIPSLVVLQLSCKKMIQVDSPIDKIITKDVFSDDQSATGAVVGLYSTIMGANMFFASGAMTLYPGLSADEIYNTFTNSNGEFTSNHISVTNSSIQNNIWRYGYNYIYQANAILEGLSRSQSLSEATRNQLTGEMKFMRAFCFFYLTNLFGDVPLTTTTDYRLNAVMPRTPKNQIYRQIISDLKEADSLLNTEYVTAGKVRPNKWAAVTLLARAYLYNKDWMNAALTATRVIQSGDYTLEKDLNKVFLANSTEAIWQLMPVVGFPFETYEGFAFVSLGNSVPNYPVTDFLVNAFELNDRRKAEWLGTVNANGLTYYYPYKYKIKIGGNPVIEYEMVLRYAELYLIRAESRANLGRLSEAEKDLDAIRERAGLVPVETLYPSLDKAGLLKAIAHERQVELFCEWGHRWFDLKRNGTANDILRTEKMGWEPTAVLYPIPLSEIRANPALIQNEGY